MLREPVGQKTGGQVLRQRQVWAVIRTARRGAGWRSYGKGFEGEIPWRQGGFVCAGQGTD